MASAVRDSSPCSISTSCRQLGRMPQRFCDLPALLPLLCPKLEGLLPPELEAPLEQRHRLIRQQLPHRDFELLTPAIPAAWPEVEHMAAIAEPGLLGRQRRPVAGSTAHATSGAQPRWRCRSSVQPLQRWVRCSPWAISPWCRWQVSSGMQLGPGWCRKKWQVMQTWRLRLERSTVLIEPGPVLDCLVAGGLQTGEGDRHHGDSCGRTSVLAG